VTPEEYARKTARQAVAVTCLCGLVLPVVLVLEPRLPTLENPGAGTVALLVLALPLLAALYFVTDVALGWLSGFLLTIPPFGKWTRWADSLPPGRPGRVRRLLYFGAVICFYSAIGLLCAVGLARYRR